MRTTVARYSNSYAGYCMNTTATRIEKMNTQMQNSKIWRPLNIERSPKIFGLALPGAVTCKCLHQPNDADLLPFCRWHPSLVLPFLIQHEKDYLTHITGLNIVPLLMLFTQTLKVSDKQCCFDNREKPQHKRKTLTLAMNWIMQLYDPRKKCCFQQLFKAACF